MIPYLLCECRNGHQWKLALPWWSFKINGIWSRCPECKKPIDTAQFMGEPKDAKEPTHAQ